VLSNDIDGLFKNITGLLLIRNSQNGTECWNLCGLQQCKAFFCYHTNILAEADFLK
jgi:hypothetical protein